MTGDNHMESAEMDTRAKQLEAVEMDTITQKKFLPHDAAPNPLLLTSLSLFVSVRGTEYNLRYLLQTGILRLSG
jgi:hypothetical protein